MKNNTNVKKLRVHNNVNNLSQRPHAARLMQYMLRNRRWILEFLVLGVCSGLRPRGRCCGLPLGLQVFRCICCMFPLQCSLKYPLANWKTSGITLLYILR